MLSCSCDEGCLEETGDWLYYFPDDFTTLQTKRRRRCCSCGSLINLGSICLKFDRIRYPSSAREMAIWGEDGVPAAPYFMCESCGEIYMNLQDAGYCLYIEDDMRKAIQQYWDLTGFKPEKGE